MGENETTKTRGWFIQSGVVLGITFLYILDQFISTPMMTLIIGVYLFFAILFMIVQIEGFVKYMSLAMLLFGALILLVSGSSFAIWVDSVSINHTLVALFVSVPLLGITVKSKQYLEALQGLYVKYLYNPTIFTAATQLLTHCMAIVLNMGAVSIFYHLSSDHPYLKTKRFVLTALLRGFASAIVWSPFFAAMALVTNQLQLEWASVLPYLLGFVAISFIVSLTVDLIIQFRMNSRNELKSEVAVAYDSSNEAMTSNVNWRKLIELFLLLVVMIGFVFLFDRLTRLTMPTVVILTAFIFPAAWFLLKKRHRFLLNEGKQYVQKTVPLFKKEAVLFLATGFFSGAVSQTSFGDGLATFLTTVFQDFTIGISFFIALTVILFSLIGFHPIMLITLYITSVDPTLLGMSPSYYAVLLLGSWGLATPVSPMTAISQLLGSLTHERVFTLSFRWNIIYCISGLIFLILYVSFLSKWSVL